MKNNLQSLLSIYRSNRGRKQANYNDKKPRCLFESNGYENNQQNERFVPLLNYHTRRNFQETNVSNEHYQALLKYHSDKDSSQQQSPDDPLL